MGIGQSKPQFKANNYVLDYSVNLLKPSRYGQIMQRSGPNVNSFPQHGKNQISSDFNECITSADPALVTRSKKLKQISYGACGLFILGTILPFVFIALEYNSIAIVLGLVFCCCGCTMACTVGQKEKAVDMRWREQVLTKLQSKLAVWKTNYPAFTFSVIYPVEERRHTYGGESTPTLVAIWCYVRVTQGPCSRGPNEPLYATTTDTISAAPVAQQQVMIQQPQQVMVQTGNGQFVAGKATIVNGQHVIMIQQPMAQQPMQYPQEPVMAQQQLQQIQPSPMEGV